MKTIKSAIQNELILLEQMKLEGKGITIDHQIEFMTNLFKAINVDEAEYDSLRESVNYAQSKIDHSGIMFRR
jgi:hypothetical protein